MCPNESEFTEHILCYTHALLSAEVFQNTFILAPLCLYCENHGRGVKEILNLMW